MNIEEKIDLDMRLAKLEKSRENHRERLDNHFDFWRELREKIEGIYVSTQFDIDRITGEIDKLKLEIKEIKRFQDITHLQYKKVIGHAEKSPYKCPVCDGTTEMRVHEVAEKDYQIAKKGQLITKISQCSACEGEGIVWGSANG